jgi:hypothetical protein
MIVYEVDLEHDFTFDDAFLYVITMTAHGKYNWRIPTHDEWSVNDEIPYHAWQDHRMETAWHDPSKAILQDGFPLFPVRDDD